MEERKQKNEANGVGMAAGFNPGQSKDGGLGYEEEVSPTIRGVSSANDPSVVISMGSGAKTDGEAVCFKGNGNEQGSVSNTITGDHGDRVTDFTPIVVDMMGGKAGCHVSQDNVSPTLTRGRASANDVHAVVQIGVDLYNRAVTGDVAATLDAHSCATSSRNGPYVLASLDGDKINKKERKGGSGLGVGSGEVSYTITAKDIHAVAVSTGCVGVDLYNGITTGDAAATVSAESCKTATRNGPCLIESRPASTFSDTGHGDYWSEGKASGTIRAEGENRPSRPSNVVVELSPEAYGVSFDINYGCPVEKEVAQTQKIGTAPGTYNGVIQQPVTGNSSAYGILTNCGQMGMNNGDECSQTLGVHHEAGVCLYNKNAAEAGKDPSAALNPHDAQTERIYGTEGAFHTLSGNAKGGMSREGVLLPFTKTSHPMNSDQPQDFREAEVAKTLNTFSSPSSEGRAEELICFQQNQRDEVRLMSGDGKSAGAVNAEPGMHNTNYVAAIAENVIGRRPENGGHHLGVNETGAAYTQEAVAPQGVCSVNPQSRLSVRRLLPVETERLMGFPDGHTIPVFSEITDELVDQFIEIHYQWSLLNSKSDKQDEESGDDGERDEFDDVEEQSNAEEGESKAPQKQPVVKRPSRKKVRAWLEKISNPETCPDSPRYKACGNSFCINCIEWIGRRIQLVEEQIKCGKK